jgi:hypothetical protein
MISKENNLNSLVCGLLGAGSLDVDFLINLVDTIDNYKFKIKGEETFLFDVNKEGEILRDAIDSIRDNIGENHKIDINSLIYEVLRIIADRINELYNIELEEGEDYEIYTNFLDSHLYLKEGKLNEQAFIDLSEQDKKEIEAIFQEFN